MTREEKVKKIKEKINKEANKKINESKQLLKYLFSKSDDESNSDIDICINEIYLYKSILYWVNKGTFCNETYENNIYIINDRYLDIMLPDSFSFCLSYIVSIEIPEYIGINQEILIHIGDSFNDKYIINRVITIFDEIFYDKDLKKENKENGKSD